MYDLYTEGYNICKLFPEYQVVFAVHDNNGHLHMHIGIVPLNLVPGKKLNLNCSEIYKLTQELRGMFKKYGIGVNVIFK